MLSFEDWQWVGQLQRAVPAGPDPLDLPAKFLPKHPESGDQIHFGCWDVDDTPVVEDFWRDTRTRSLLGTVGPMAVPEQWLLNELFSNFIGGVQCWPLFRQSNGAHIGCAGLSSYRGSRTEFQIGLHLRSDGDWLNISKDVLRPILDFGFREARAMLVLAAHADGNAECSSLLLRAGFQRSPMSGRHYHFSWQDYARMTRT